MSKVEPLTVSTKVTHGVVKYFERVCEKSLLFDSACESGLPKFQVEGEILCIEKILWHEINISFFVHIELVAGGTLGIGGFCKVSEVSEISLVSDDGNNVESRNHMSKYYLRDGDARYAIKRLRTDINRKNRLKGIFDLSLEAKFLSVIDHPHIIKIRAMGSAEYLSKDFFVILDRLYNTLEKQIEIWAQKKRVLSVLRLLDLKGKKKKNLLMTRLNVAYDIASAVGHLHENRYLNMFQCLHFPLIFILHFCISFLVSFIEIW